MEGTIAPEQIIINGQEYSPEDATQLIELGNKWRETESKLNTSLDKVYPEYTRATQQNKEYQTKLAERDAELEKYRATQQKAERDAQTPTEIQNARKAARELGLADEDFLKEKGYMTRDEVKQFMTEAQSLQQQSDKILKQAQDFEKQIDGSDGRVPFDSDAVLTYAAYKNISNLEEAYGLMNAKGNAKWQQAQLDKQETKGLTTLRPGGGKKEPVRPKITDDNLGAMLSELVGQINN